MGRLQEYEFPAPTSSSNIGRLVERVKLYLRKDRTLRFNTHIKMIKQDYRGLRPDMVEPTLISIEGLHRMAKRGIALVGVVYVQRNSVLDVDSKTDAIGIRPDNTAVAVQIAGNASNAKYHRKRLRSVFEVEDLSTLPLVVTKIKTNKGRTFTPQEYCTLYEQVIKDAPGIPLETLQRRIKWKE